MEYCVSDYIFLTKDENMKKLIKNGQILTAVVDLV